MAHSGEHTEQRFTLSRKGEEMAAAAHERDAIKPDGIHMFDKVRTATATAYDLIPKMSAARKNRFPFEHSRLLDQFKKLVSAQPCWLDLDARYKIRSFASQYNLLHHAAEYGQAECIDLLLKAGANIDAVSDKGTALAIAIAHGYPDCARLLIERGADVSLYTPSDEEKERFGISTDASRAPIMVAAGHVHSDVTIPLLCQRGANPNIHDTHWRECPLHKTYFSSDVGAARALIAYGANPNLHSHRTVIYEAARGATPEYITLLMDAGADLTLELSHGESAIACADFWNGTHRRDPEKMSRLELFQSRMKEGEACWQSVQERFAGGNADAVTSLAPREIILCSNVGKLDDLLGMRQWYSTPEKLAELLPQLPFWMTEHIANHHPDLLVASASANAPKTTWQSRISPPNPERSR